MTTKRDRNASLKQSEAIPKQFDRDAAHDGWAALWYSYYVGTLTRFCNNKKGSV